MKPKKTRGFTLVEMIVAISLLTILAAGIGVVMHSASQHYAANQKMQEDEYNARFALLFIAREVHKGVSKAEAEDDGDNSALTLTMLDDTVIRFHLKDGALHRTVAGGTISLPFQPVELEKFTAELRDERWLTLYIQCQNGLELHTTISLSRVAQSGDDL